MKSSSSEESVRKRSHSVGGNSLAPSMLSTMTTTNICDIDDVITDTKQDVIGEQFLIIQVAQQLNSNYSSNNYLDGNKAPKYTYHDEPHSFETSMDYLVVTSANDSLSLSETAADLNSSNASPEVQEPNASEHIYSNSHFKFEVLETTV